MQEIKAALIWIVNILNRHQIPFQISGGLAARVYGATRPIIDIDIDIPENKFIIIQDEVSIFIIYGPERFKSDKWDLLLMTLDYHGQLIDLSGAYQTKVFNAKTAQWHELSEDLSQAVNHDIFGLQLPIIPRDTLLAYKKILSRKEDIQDINEIVKNQ